MSWLLNHKLIVLAIIACIVYAHTNPAGRFGIARQGFVVYNRIPIFLFDCYIGPDNDMHLESDLGVQTNVNYWFENHFSPDRVPNNNLLPLLIGTGFSDSGKVAISGRVVQDCRIKGFETHFYTSQEAIAQYNQLRESGKKAGILLKLM